MFDKVGIIIVEKDNSIDEDELAMVAIDAGAQDFSAEDEEFEIITEPSNFQEVKEAIEKGYKISEAEVTMLPKNTIQLSPEDYEKFEKLIDKLEENDDVQNVYHNVEIEDENDE